MSNYLTIGKRPNKKNIETKIKSFKALTWKRFNGLEKILIIECDLPYA